MTEPTLDTVLVVGGSGFLGSHIVQRLRSGNHASHIAIASRNPKQIDSHATYHAIDITSETSIIALFETVKPQVVIHTATPLVRSHAAGLLSTNVTGTQNLLRAAKACIETQAFIYTSSDSACHPSPSAQITEEECNLHDSTTFNNAYGKSKALADAAVLAANSNELRTATIRVPTVYGEGNTSFIAQVVASIQKGEHKNQVGPNEKIFEYVYVESAAEAHILAAKALVSGVSGADGQAFFVTDGVPMPFFDFYRKCCDAAGHAVAKEDVKVVPFWVVQMFAGLGEWMYWVFTLGSKTPTMRRDDIDHLDSGCHWSIEKAERLLGYKPVVEQEIAIKRSMDWGMKSVG